MLSCRYKLIFLFFCIGFIGLTTNSFAVCTIPSDDLTINSDTTLCAGDYQINDSGSAGVIIIGSNNVKLDCNSSYMHGNGTTSGFGIYFDTKDNILLTNCNISDYMYGIYITNSNSNTTIKNNNLFKNKNAITLDNIQYASIINNKLYNNSGTGTYHGAITISNTNSNNSIITNNTIEDNSRGIRILSGNYNNITSNKIRRNSNNNLVLDNSNAKYTLLETNIIEPGTTYGGYATISINNIFADWTAGPPSNYLSDFPTITEALSISSPGDIIYAFSNEYPECPAITKTITLTGEERDSTKITCTSGTALNITGNNAIIANLTLSTQGSTSPALTITANNTIISNISIKNQANGIKIDSSDNNTLDNLKLENLTYPVNITTSTATTINMSIITNGTIHALDSLTVHITNTTFTQSSSISAGETTSLENTNNSEITGNTYTNIQTLNIKITKSTLINITQNTFTATTAIYNAISLENTTHTQIQRNTINKSYYAITTYSTDDITIDSNTINSTTETCIMLMNSNNTLITNNTLNAAKKGVHITSGNSNTLYNNTIRYMTDAALKLMPDEETMWTEVNQTLFHATFDNWSTSTNCQNATGEGWTTCYSTGGYWRAETGNNPLNTSSTKAFRGSNINNYGDAYIIKCLNLSSYAGAYLNFIWNTTDLLGDEGIKIYSNKTGSPGFNLFWYSGSADMPWTRKEIDVTSNISANTCFRVECRATAITETCYIDDFKIIGKTSGWQTENNNAVYINNTIEKNTITSTATAISAQNTYRTKITENTITNITGTRSITLENSTEDNITYNNLNTGITAITLFNTNQTLIKANTFSNHTFASIYFNWSSAYNTKNTIKDNTITGKGTDTGLEIKINTNIAITNNTISGTMMGINIDNANASTITNNTIAYASTYGIGLQNSRQNTVDNNTIIHSKWNAIYVSGNPLYQDTNSSIKNNNIYNATGWSGIYLQNFVNSTISSNMIEYTKEGLYILNSQRNNITENTFKNNINYGLDISDSSSINNSLWMNNFSDISNIFRENYNNYCVLGLDNYYRNSSYDNPPFSCSRSFIPTFNDTAIYAGETINYAINTSYGESSYTLINITINSRNYTTTLASGTSIKGLWTYTYTNTTQIGKYNATMIYYNEADNDKGISGPYTTSFEVLNLSITTNITPKTANNGTTIRINATVENNATKIDYVKSDIYWNNTLVDQKTNSSFEKINDTKRIYRLYTSNTSRSGTYTVNTTVVAGQNKSYEDTFMIYFGTANITIYSIPQLIAYNITSVQNYTIKALYGDLNNITITFRSSNESIINITTPSQTIPYLNSSQTQYLSINLTATGIGESEINITATPQNGTSNSRKKSIEVRQINLTTSAYPEIADIGSTITITSDVQNNVSDIISVSADIYWNRSLIGTVPLAFGSSTEISGIGNNQNYRYSGTTTLTNRSGTYTVNVTAVSTTNATGSDTYIINYGTANISISAYPAMMNTGTEKNQSVNITAINGDLENITIAYASNDSSILNITTESQLIPYMNSSETRQLNISIAAINGGTVKINITASPEKGTSDTKSKNMAIKELRIDTYLNTTTINITNQIRIYANITGNITTIEYVLANITWNGSIKQQLTMIYMHYDSAEEKHIYSRIITSTDRSGNYTVTTTVKADITASDTETFFVNYGRTSVYLFEDPRAISNGNKSEQMYTITAFGGDLVNVSSTISFNDTSKLDINATENTTKEISYIFNTNTSPLIWILDAKNIGSVLLNVTTTTQAIESSASKQITITGEADTVPPSVYEAWTQYETQRSNIFNLMDTAYVYANVSDNYAVKAVQANVSIPNKTSEIITLQRAIVEGIYWGSFTNTTDLDQYSILIIASDGTNTNNTETENFTTTDTYPFTIIQSESLYNRGENATITISAYGINGNLVTAFNTSLNVTYESNTTILLDSETTDTAYYYINTSVLGIHNISVNVTKNGNTGANSSTFNAVNTLNITPYTSLSTYIPISPIRDLRIYAYYGRDQEPYTNDLNVTLYCYNDTNNNLEYIDLKKQSSNTYIYLNDTGDPQCYAPTSYCQSFTIISNITDAYNNTGTKSFTLNSYCYQQSASSSSGGSSSASSGGGPGISGIPEKIKEYIFGNQTNRTIVNDFAFTLNRKEAVIKQGENTTIIGTLDNIGETDRLIDTEITQDCCNVRTESTRYFIQSKNKEDIPIHIHNSLKTIPGEYLINVVMRSENITKRETIRITIEKNPMITDLENLETKTPGLEQDIESYATAGVEVAYLKDAMNDLKTLIKAARESIERDDIENLKKNLDAAKKKYEYISLELLKLNTMKWLSENKYNIAAAGITTIFLSYMLIYFIIPYYYLKKELTGLLTKEIELKYSEKAIQKQYFMRQLDEHSFNRLLSDEHGKLLDTRSHIKQIEEKITLLKKGKLNIMDKEHSKYFILKKIVPKQKAFENMTIHREEELKSLKNQEYNINQSSKEAEKKFYSEIITQEELEQILSNNNSKLEAIRKKQLEILSKDHPVEIQNTTPKRDIIKEIRKKYEEYKIKKKENHIEAKIKELEKDEHNLERTNEEIKAKKDNIENEIETLKKEDMMLKEKEKNI